MTSTSYHTTDGLWRRRQLPVMFECSACGVKSQAHLLDGSEDSNSRPDEVEHGRDGRQLPRVSVPVVNHDLCYYISYFTFFGGGGKQPASKPNESIPAWETPRNEMQTRRKNDDPVHCFTPDMGGRPGLANSMCGNIRVVLRSTGCCRWWYELLELPRLPILPPRNC